MSNYIQYELEGSVGKITLNRPDKFNSFVREMALALQDQLKACAADEAVRAIYLTATGKAFCAGQDLAEATDDNGLELPQIVEEHYNPIVTLIRQIEKPIVCGVNGVAAGAGANIALACDIVFAGDKASFIQAFSKIGLIPDSAGTWILPRLIGLQRATALMMTGEKVNAEAAANMGMIYKAVEQDELEATAMQMANSLAAMPTKGLGLTKRLLNESFDNTFEAQCVREKEVQTEAGNTYDYKEGTAAFLEKRAPVFKGK